MGFEEQSEYVAGKDGETACRVDIYDDLITRECVVRLRVQSEHLVPGRHRLATSSECEVSPT